MKRKSVTRKIVFIAVLLLLLAAVAETGLRLAGYPATYTSIFTFDEELGYRYQPGEHQFFVADQRQRVQVDDACVLDRTEGTPQVLILSDGLVAGLELDASDRLARRVRERTGFEVLNLSVPGYGTVQQWLTLRRWLSKGITPSHVVVVYNFVNDYADNVPEWENNRVPGLRQSTDGSGITFPVLPPRWGRLVRRVVWQSRIFNLGSRLNRYFFPVKPAFSRKQALLFSTNASAESQRGDIATRLASNNLKELQQTYGFTLLWIGWHDYGLELRAGLTGDMQSIAHLRLASLTGAEPLVSQAIAPPRSMADIPAWERRWLSPGTRHANGEATAELGRLIGMALEETRL